MITSPEEYIKRLADIQNQDNLKELVMLPTDEPRFIIDANSRTITIPDAFTFIGVQNDHAAETIYFEIDRYFDQHDLSTEMCVVQFEAVGHDGQKDEGFYPITKIDVDSVPGKVLFGWKILNDVTKYDGNVYFSVRFYSIETVGYNQRFKYNFNTLPTSLPVKSSLNSTGEGTPVDPTALEVMSARFAEIERRAKEGMAGAEGWRNQAEEIANSMSDMEARVRSLNEEANRAATAANSSRDGARTSEVNAKASEEAAKQSEQNAATSETAALNSQNKAKASEDAALKSEKNAKQSELNAKASENAALTSQNAAKASENASLDSENKAKQSESNAKASEEAALASQNAAKESETKSKSSENAAKVSENNAAASASAAADSQTKAAANQTATENSAAEALANKNAAAQSEANAKASEKAAQASETAAANSENNAQASAEAAARSAEEAKSATSTDKTLTIEGSPADAKAVGEALDINKLVEALATEDTTPTDSDYFVGQHVNGGGETDVSYRRKPLSALWNWIKGKADAVYSAIGHKHTKSDITDFPTLGAAAAKAIRTLTNIGTSGWKDAATDQQYVPDMAFMAYWNGAYSGTSSNLAYCNKGAFGSMATLTARRSHNTTDTRIPVFSNDDIDYILKNEIGCTGFSIGVQSSDPGADSSLTTNRILFVYE